ncbi:PIG-L deacetylase family protein [Deinococcus radiophilus]|uniref:PIG-L deacetylase family protein n=1 Tax=Deinococcus radiophilus TaxID=32062 RepID=UPI003620FB6A
MGARGLLAPHDPERLIRDLRHYLRQPAPDAARLQVGPDPDWSNGPVELTDLESVALNPATLSGPVWVVAPHPDDEALGCGALLAALVAQGTEVWACC